MVSLLLGSGTGVDSTKTRLMGRHGMGRTRLANARLVGMLDRNRSSQVGVNMRG
jgi:hypothetical protein